MPQRPPFDINRPLRAALEFTFAGKVFHKGDDFPAAGFNPRLVRRQYEARKVDHTDTPAGEDQDEQVTMTGPKGGRYTIAAPWMEKPEVVRGKADAVIRFKEIKDEGAPLGWIEGGTETSVTGGEGGWYEVSAPWLEEAEKVQGREAAERRQREIHDAGAPEPDGEGEDEENELGEVDHPEVLVTVNEDETFTVTAPWLSETETYDEVELAEARQTELRAEGPPEGWEPPADTDTE